MSSEVFEALSLLEKERGIPVDFMLDKIKKAILTACKSSYNGNDDAIINMNPDTGVFEVYLQKTVVEEVEDKGREISLLDAREIDPNTAVGEKGRGSAGYQAIWPDRRADRPEYYPSGHP